MDGNQIKDSGRCVVSLQQAIENLIASKVRANRRPAYVRSLKFYLLNFARGREGMPAISLDRNHVEAWFAARTEAPVSRKTGMQLLSVFFQHAIHSGIRESNPITDMDRVTVDWTPPRILTPKEVRRILNFSKTHLRWRLPQIVLGIYAGIRPSELTRISFQDINLDRGYVTINAAASKTRQRRVIHLDPKCIAWLKKCQTFIRPDEKIGSLCTTWKKIIARNCGVEWSQGIFRHTAASYLIAKHGDAGRVARMLGNSEQVLLRHYVELVTPEAARRFWKCSFAHHSQATYFQ